MRAMPQLHSPSRRAVLAALAIAPIAGCSSLGPFSGDSSSKSQLEVTSIVNRDSTPHTVDFRVEWDGDLVHDRTYDIEANDPDADRVPGVVPERTWPASPGQFTVSARRASGEWKTVDPAEDGYPDCFAVHVGITPTGRLRLLTSNDTSECSNETDRTA